MREKVNTQDFSFLKEVFSELDLLNNLGISINLISPTATLTDLLLNEITEPFEVINSIPVNYLRYLHMGFIGPRMETLSLGNLGQASVVDMDKAFLRELAFVPSLRKRNIRQVVKGSNTFYEDSHPGSVYTIQVEIPSSYSSFAPIPQRVGEHIRYPIGFIESTIVSKLYVERLIKDRVPFRILDSLQVRLRSQDTTDFSSFSDRVIQVENCLKGLKYINPKMLHYSLVGSMLAIHREIKDSIIYVASRNYNPLIANTIQARVAMKSWEKSITELSEVIAVDSVIGKELVVTPGWTSKGTGETLIVTPYVKDKGGSSKYRTLLNNYRDSFSFPLSFPNRRLSLKECARTPKKTGTLENSICHIAPSGQGRLPTLQIKKLGYLLDHKVSTVIPNAQDPIGEVFELPEWLLKTGGV
jgi:hypothetical protein